MAGPAPKRHPARAAVQRRVLPVAALLGARPRGVEPTRLAGCLHGRGGELVRAALRLLRHGRDLWPRSRAPSHLRADLFDELGTARGRTGGERAPAGDRLPLPVAGKNHRRAGPAPSRASLARLPARRRTYSAWENIGSPGVSSSARSRVPVRLSVMNRLRCSGPPNARLVVPTPAQDTMRSSGSATGDRRQTEPNPVWQSSRLPSASSASPSGPPGPPCRWAKMPTLVISPLAGSGTRQIWLARVTATSRKLSSESTTMPFGLGIVLTRQVSRPSGVSFQTRPVGSCMPVWP